MRFRNLIFVLLLVFIISCDPSYKIEVSDLSEEEYNDLSFEEKFKVFEKVSGYIDTPDYVSEGIAKEGEKAISFILGFLNGDAPITKKIDMIYLLVDIHKQYYDLKGTYVEGFLRQKILEESSSKRDKYLLDVYIDALEKVQKEIVKDVIPVMLTPGFDDIPAFYSDDEDMTSYVSLIKEKIMQETGINQKDLDANFSIKGYAKGEKIVLGIMPIDHRTVILSFVAKIDWVKIQDDFLFNFLDEKGNKLSLEEIKQQINVPFYFKIKKLKPESEIKEIVAKTNPKLNAIIKPDYVRINFLDEEVLLEVSGVINETKNQCISGTINLVNGKINVNKEACMIIDY